MARIGFKALTERREVALKKPKSASALRNADRKSTRLNSSHANISYAVFCLKKKKIAQRADVKRLQLTSPPPSTLNILERVHIALSIGWHDPHYDDNANHAIIRVPALTPVTP